MAAPFEEDELAAADSELVEDELAEADSELVDVAAQWQVHVHTPSCRS
jgi:hypothetical protein